VRIVPGRTHLAGIRSEVRQVIIADKVSTVLFGDDRKNEAAANELKRQAFELGYEVGLENHIETVGWVNSKLQSIKRGASRAGALEDVSREFQRGKKLGIASRAKRIVVPQSGLSKKLDERQGAQYKGVVSRSPQIGRESSFVERIPAKEGIKSTVNVIKFAASKPEVKKDLNGLFAGIFDIQEKVLDVEAGDSPRETFERCLKLLAEVGWIENYDLDSFDQAKAVVTLKSTTAIAAAFGRSDEPLCQPICNLLETVGRKTFKKSVMVVEVECVAQGNSACKFEISPRKALTG
jgi:hypothetical protein